MKDKKIFGTISLVVAIMSIIVMLIPGESVNLAKTVSMISLIFALIAIILGFIGKKDAKKLSISAIVIGFIMLVFNLFALLGFSTIENAKDCVDNGDGTATCVVFGQETSIPTNQLTEDQMKK